MSAQPNPQRHTTPAAAQATVERIEAQLASPIAYRPEFAQLGGCGNAGLMLSQMWYWQARTTLAGGWFWKSARDWQAETGLTRREQETAIKRLVERKLVETHRRSRRAPLYFRVNASELLAQLAQLSPRRLRPRLVAATAAVPVEAPPAPGSNLPEGSTSMADRCNSVWRIGASGVAPIRHTSETTQPETTLPENTHTLPRASARVPEAPAARVGVSQSRFSFSQRKQYAANNRDRASELLGGGWLNTSRDGSSDELIADWFARSCPPAGTPLPQRDVSACPDCHGSGWWYPDGRAKGTAKCLHPRLAHGAQVLQPAEATA